jgi:ABC-2 type transport system permease protein
VRLGWREAAADRVGLAARALLYVLPVLIFGAIWRATPLEGTGHDAGRLTWYVTATETIVFSIGHLFREIEDDIRSGVVEAALTRPLPYVAARIAEDIGGTAWRFLTLGAFGATLAWIVTGEVPFGWAAVPALIATGALAALLALLFQVVIGLMTAWIGPPAPVYWIWQKLVFVFGGLFLPLTLYPGWLRQIGEATPFGAMLFHPASLVLDASPAAVLRVFAWQGVWLVFAGLLVVLVATAATRRFVREGVGS